MPDLADLRKKKNLAKKLKNGLKIKEKPPQPVSGMSREDLTRFRDYYEATGYITNNRDQMLAYELVQLETAFIRADESNLDFDKIARQEMIEVELVRDIYEEWLVAQ